MGGIPLGELSMKYYIAAVEKENETILFHNLMDLDEKPTKKDYDDMREELRNDPDKEIRKKAEDILILEISPIIAEHVIQQVYGADVDHFDNEDGLELDDEIE